MSASDCVASLMMPARSEMNAKAWEATSCTSQTVRGTFTKGKRDQPALNRMEFNASDVHCRGYASS